MVSDLGAPAAGEGSGKSVLLCLDGNFDTSRGAFEWALNSLIQDGDEVHIVMVKPPSGLDKALSAATGTTATMSIQQEQKAQALLSAAVAFTEAIAALHESKLRLRAVHKHTLVTGGLFQHAGAALVDYAKANGIDLAVISSMRTAPAKRCLLKCVCLGGISGYCLHRMPCSVGIATVWEELDDTLTMESLGLTPSIMLPAADEVSSTKVCIAFDDSEPARLMVKWAAEKLLTKRDIVHVITVAREVGRVTDCHFQSQGNIDMAHRDYEEATAEAIDDAQETASMAVQVMAKLGVPAENLRCGGVHRQIGGPSYVGKSICDFVDAKGFDMLLVANQGRGAFQRSMGAIQGLGSVSEFCVHNVLSCPVLVFKHRG